MKQLTVRDFGTLKNGEKAHLYIMENENGISAAVTDYGARVPAMVARGNLFGCQFHPEKSGKVGLAMLKNFAKLTEVEM